MVYIMGALEPESAKHESSDLVLMRPVHNGPTGWKLFIEFLGFLSAVRTLSLKPPLTPSPSSPVIIECPEKQMVF